MSEPWNFNDDFWTLDRLIAQRDHLDSLLLVSAGQNDPRRPQLRAEHRAVCAEIARLSRLPENTGGGDRHLDDHDATPAADGDLAAGLADHAGLINVLIGAWHDFGYATPPGPDCATVPPLGQRSAAAVKAAHDALNAVDEMTRQLQALRGQLAGELRRDEELRKEQGQ